MNAQEIADAVTVRIEARKQAAAERQAQLRRTRAVLAARRAAGLRQRHNRKINRRRAS